KKTTMTPRLNDNSLIYSIYPVLMNVPEAFLEKNSVIPLRATRIKDENTGGIFILKKGGGSLHGEE
ncbi:MAG TPA: hypothetical protein PKJ03_06420, partial [Methanoregulaceae archaeon]|nr:hypothetical protein [Methanoregulaceae archaeon]